MILKSDKYRVRVLDKQNIAVEEIRKVKKGKGNEMEGEEYIGHVSYFRTMEQAMDHLLNLQILDKFREAKDFKELVESVKEIRDNMRKLLNEGDDE